MTAESTLISAADKLKIEAQLTILTEFRDQIDSRIRDLKSALESAKPSAANSNLEQKLAKVDWKKKDEGFSWAFTATMQGTQLPEVQEVISAIQNEGGKLAVGDFEYSVSENKKFLQKRHVK